MDELDQERLEVEGGVKEMLGHEPGESQENDAVVAFAAIPVFVIIGALLSLVAAFVMPRYSFALFAVAALLGLGAFLAYTLGSTHRTRGL